MDYISGFHYLFLAAFGFLLNTNPGLNWMIYYIFGYCILFDSVHFPESWMSIPLQVSIDGHQYQLLVYLLLFVMFMKAKIGSEILGLAIRWLGQFNLVLSLIAIPFGMQFLSGLVPNKSMNAILCSMCLPYVCQSLDEIDVVGLIATLIVVFCASSSCGFAALLAVIVGALYISHQVPKWMVLTVSCLMIGAAYILIPGLLNGTGRGETYRFFFKFLDKKDWWIGTGPATFFPLSAFLQSKLHFRTPDQGLGYIMHLHSDPLQYIYEYGLIGLIPLGLTGIWIYYNAPTRALLGILAMCAGSLFYYPFHFPWHLAVFFLLIKIVNNNYKKALSR